MTGVLESVFEHESEVRSEDRRELPRRACGENHRASGEGTGRGADPTAGPDTRKPGGFPVVKALRAQHPSSSSSPFPPGNFPLSYGKTKRSPFALNEKIHEKTLFQKDAEKI